MALRTTFITTEIFIERAKLKHGDRYDYSNILYMNNKQHVQIVCRVHGPFNQRPGDHLYGHGCPICGKQRARKSTEEFVRVAKLLHGEKYDYSNVQYVNRRTKVSIGCKQHGLFTQTPYHHLRWHGCPRCSGTFSTEDFVERARLKHGETYLYSRTVYQKSNQNVVIECRVHGEFMQWPHNHLEGHGCPKCGTEKARERKREILQLGNESMSKRRKLRETDDM